MLALAFMLSTSIPYLSDKIKEGDDHGNHGTLKEWFNQLHSDKGACCSFADGYSISDADWESHDGHYRVHIPRSKPTTEAAANEMVWVEVPDDAVVREPNLVGRTVVWPIYNAVAFGAKLPSIRCFLPGTMS
jgi:hypothetical protein